MFEKAIEIIMAEPPELHYPAYFADLLRAKDSEIPNSSDLISRQALCEYALNQKDKSITPNDIMRFPSAQKTHEKRTETHSCDLIDRQQAIDTLGEGAMVNYQAAGHDNGLIKAIDVIKGLPSAKPEISLLTVKVAPDPKELERVVRKIKDASVMVLPSAESEQQNSRVFQGIIVEYPSISTYPEYEGKPYFSIKYTEDGQDFIGYGTYKPEVLSEYLKKYFMPFARKKGKWIVDALASNIYHCSECGTDAPVEPTGGTEYKSNYCPYCGLDMRGEADV